MATSPERERPLAESEDSEGEGPLDTRDGATTNTMPSGESSRLDAALRYASYGWHVFPLQPGTKVPLHSIVVGLEHGHLDASCDTATVAGWWQRWPDANIGVALKPSGLCVLDVDPRNGGDPAALDAAVDLGSPLTQTTGGGGVHYIYTDRGVDLRSSLGYAGLDGIDVKNDGYIVVAPSVTTGPYVWDDDELHVESMPSMVLDLTRAPKREQRSFATANEQPLNDREQAYIDAALNDACQRLASTPEGQRHAAVYYTARALGEYVGGGVLPLDRARARITQAAEQLYGEALWNVEVKTIEQGLTKGFREPRGIPDEYDGGRRLLVRIADASDPMAIIELYAENNPELIRQFGHEVLDPELESAIKNIEAVGGDEAGDRFEQLVREA